MATYQVDVTATIRDSCLIEADNETEARRLAEESLHEEITSGPPGDIEYITYGCDEI